MRRRSVLGIGLALLGPLSWVLIASAWEPPTWAEVSAHLDGLSFDEFIETSYRDYVLRFPEWVTRMGMAEAFGVRDDRLNDVSSAYVRETMAIEDEILRRLTTYDRERLTPVQRRTYDACFWYWEDLVRGHPFVDYDYPVSHFFVTSLDLQVQELLLEIHPLVSTANAEDYVARLEAIGPAFDGIVEGLGRRAAAGIVLPRPMIEMALPGIRQIMYGTVGDSPYLARLREALLRVSSSTEAWAVGLLARAERAVGEVVVPAYRSLYDALVGLRPLAPRDIGVGQYPGGDVYYAYLVRHYTGTELTPAEIHEMGRCEVDRVQAEIRERAVTLGYSAGMSIESLFAAFERDGGTLYDGEILAEYARLIERAKQDSLAFLPSLPTTEVVVREDPIGGFYRPAPRDGSAPAVFGAQASGGLPRFTMPTLAAHETIPGHHVQIASAQEMDLPLLLSETTFLGFTEGWALYAERLAWESGWYIDDPYADLGRLQYELMRAARLVVDTGIHGLGWGFDRALSYYRGATGRPQGYAQYDIYRYAAWPGQAVAYTVGSLSLLKLRSFAEECSGDDFDLLAFHDTILRLGNLPLQLLADAVRREYAP